MKTQERLTSFCELPPTGSVQIILLRRYLSVEMPGIHLQLQPISPFSKMCLRNIHIAKSHHLPLRHWRMHMLLITGKLPRHSCFCLRISCRSIAVSYTHLTLPTNREV